MSYYLWLDVETTGLEKDAYLLEVGARMTHLQDGQLVSVGEPFDILIEYQPEILRLKREKIDPVVEKMHTENGLWEALNVGPTVHLLDAVVQWQGWLSQFEGAISLAGRNVYFDRRAMIKAGFLMTRISHRQFDLSSLDHLGGLVGVSGNQLKKLRKLFGKTPHRALADVDQEINQANWWLSHFKFELPKSS